MVEGEDGGGEEKRVGGEDGVGEEEFRLGWVQWVGERKVHGASNGRGNAEKRRGRTKQGGGTG